MQTSEPTVRLVESLKERFQIRILLVQTPMAATWFIIAGFIYGALKFTAVHVIGAILLRVCIWLICVVAHDAYTQYASNFPSKQLARNGFVAYGAVLGAVIVLDFHWLLN